MPKRWLIPLVLFACAVIAAVLYATRARDRQPSYRGRSLSSWLAEVRQDSNQGVAYVTAAEAVRQIGTNAVPHLIRWIQEEPAPWKRSLFEAANEQLRPLGKGRRIDPAETRHAIAAINGFILLGPDAKAAIPDLTRLMNAPGPSITANAAAAVMPYLGQGAVPPLSLLLTNQTLTTGARNLALINLYALGTNALALVPTLAQCLNDPDTFVRGAATNELHRLAPEALTNAPPK